MSATSSGSDKRDDGSPPGALGSSTKEIGEGTEGKVDNACNSQTHSTPHSAQCETNHTSIPAHTHSTDETHQDGASCNGDKGAKVEVQREGLTSVAEKVSNSEQKCMVKSSFTEVVGTQSGRNEDSESSVEDEDQSGEVQSSGGKGGKQDKTCSITRSDNDARDHRDKAVQEGEKITLDENHRGKSDCNSLPKGNEQKNRSDRAIPGVKDEKPDQKINDTEKIPSVNESDFDDVAMQEAEIKNHDQNSELKHTVKRPSGNGNDIYEGAMQRAKDENHDQNNGNKDIDNRPERNEKDTDDKIRPSVENENNGDSDTEERPMKNEENDKGDITTQVVKEESPDVNKKINNTKKESRENEKKDHPYNGTTKDKDDRTKSISQARNLELSDKTSSVLGDPDKPFDDSDGGTKESKDKGALPETTPLTQTAQPCNQMDNYACHRDEVGATHLEASHETSSSSQSQDDYTILDKQLDGVFNEILTKSNLKENIEELKKSAREKIKSLFLAKIMDGTLSQRSFYPCATKNMPLQIFDSDIHNTETLTGDAKGAMQGGGAEGGPSSSQHKLGYDPSKYATKQHEESIGIGVEKNRQEPSRQTGEKVNVKSFHGKTSNTPNPDARKLPLSQSSSSKIPAETNRKDVRAGWREQSARDGPSSSQHSQANDPSQCITEPAAEKPFIDSEENRQWPPELSTPQTEGIKSLHEKDVDNKRTGRSLPDTPLSGSDTALSKTYRKKTSNATDPPIGGTPFSKSCLPGISTPRRATDCPSSISQIDMDFKKNAEGVRTESLRSTAGSSQRPTSEDHQGMQNENTMPLDYPSGMPFVESHFASDTALSQREDKKEVWKHDYSFVVEAEKRFKEEEWELQVECSLTEYLKLLFIFSNETLKMKAGKTFQSLKIILHEGYSMRLKTTCMCIKPEGHTELDGLFIDDVLSAFKSLFPLVHLIKIVMDQSTGFEEIENYCLANHKACEKNLVHLFYNEKRRDEIWVAVEHGLQDFGNEVVKDLLSNKLATECPLEHENNNLIGYFVQSAASKYKDLRLFDLLKENKYLAEKYQDMNVYENDKWVVISGQKEIHKYLFEKLTVQSWSVPPSLKELLNSHEVVDFINQSIQAKHPNEPMIWMLTEKSILEMFALHKNSAICGMKTVQQCFLERYFDDAYLQKEAFQLQELKGEKFRGKINITYLKTSVKITGTVDVFEEFIALLLKESDRLKKPLCKTVKVKNRNILNFLETHYQDNFRKWRKSVDISAVVRDETCGYAIKSSTANSDKIAEIREKLEMILSDITEITVVDGKIQLDLTGNREFRRQRCDIEKEWNVDTILEGIPGQDWSVEDGYEWCFQSGQSFTLLTLKSALPAETDVVLQPRPKLNVKGNQQTNIQKHMNRDWHVFEFEVEHGQSGKAKESLRKSLHDILQADVKRNKCQAIVFPVDLKVMEKIGWSKTRYLKQILYVVHEQFGSEPWRIFFLSQNQADHKTNVETLEESLENLNIKKTSLKIRVFPIEVNFKPGIKIEVKQGSLVQTKADVIVNTTSKELKSLQYGQISKSILDAAGSKLSEECRKKYPNGIKYSEVAVTPSFHLKQCKKIYHGGIPYFDRSLKPLKDFVWNCLVQAFEDQIETIAFPAIGTGKLNYPSEDVAATMINTVREFSEKYPGTTLLSVYFVIYDEKTLKDFEKRNESGQKAEEFQSVPDQTVRVSVIGSGDKVKDAAKCLNDLIKEIKKREETGNDIKPDTAFLLSKENKKPEKSKIVAAGDEKTITDKSANQIDKVHDDGGSWDLIFVKDKEGNSGYSLAMTECKKHLDGFNYKKIICPFGNGCQALVKFETQKDAEKVLTYLKSDLFTFEKVPVQAVHSVKAKLGTEMIHFLKINNMTEEQVENETGASLDTKEWIITGSLLEIKQAEIFFRNKYGENPAPGNTNDKTCLHQKLPGVVLPEKSSRQCTISERNAIRHFYENVLSRLYCKEDTDGWCYLSGKPEAIEEFSNALGCLYSKKFENVSLSCYTRVTKYPGVYCYYNKDERELEIFAKYREKVTSIEEIILNLESEIPESNKIFKKKISEIQAIDSSTTDDNRHVQDDHQYTMKADDFDTVCHFHKEFLTELRRTDKESNVHLTGHNDQIEKLKVVHKEIEDNFYSQELKCHGRDYDKIHEIYTQMTVTNNAHIRIKSSGSLTTVHFTAREKTEVEKMKSWFDDELKKMTKTSARPTETKRKTLTPTNDCIIFQERGIKVYAVKEDVLRIFTNTIVCPSNLQVGEYIMMAAEISVDKNRRQSSDIINIQRAPKLNSHICIIKVPNWYRYAESNNPCEDCIKDIQSIVDKCLHASDRFTSIAVPEFHSDKACRLPAVVCCMAFARGVQGFSKSHPSGSKMKALNIYYVDNNQVTINLMKMCFNQEANWEYIADDKYSIFFLNSTFQVHVKTADIFKSSAFALAASQDGEIDSKRFIANYLYNMNDEVYMSVMRGLKAKNLPTIVPAPRKSDYVKVIHFLSPSWKTKPKRDDFKEHHKSIKTLLDCASQECSSIVVPLSGGQYTSLDTRKKIAEKTVIAVAEWCKENSKKSTNLNTIYILNNDTEFIKTTIECFKNHIWKEEYSCVKRPPLSNF